MIGSNNDSFKEKFRVGFDDFQILSSIKEVMKTGPLRYDYGFEVYPDYTLQEIKMMLETIGISIDDDNLYRCIMLLLVNQREIIRNDVLSHRTTYRLLDNYRKDSNFQRHYGNFEQSFPSKILLIADTHIGNDEIEDMILVDNVYDCSIKMGCNVCIHLGDLFNGISHHEFYNSRISDMMRQALNINDYDFTEDETAELERQLWIFANKYPKCNPSEIRTYVIPGNNDKNIDRYLRQENDLFLRTDIRGISMVNPSVYVLPFKGKEIAYSAVIGNLDVNFHHFFYNSQIMPACKINSYDDFFTERNVKLRDYIYNILISGHLHEAFLMSDKNAYVNKEKLYIGVPSLGKQNLNNVVAYMLEFNYVNNSEIESVDISIIEADSDRKVQVTDVIHFSFKKKNSRFVKKLSK